MGKMLPFFPAPFLDESIISQVTRYHILRGHRTEMLTYDELFQAPPFSLTYWVPPYMGRLAKKLPGNTDENHSILIRNSTLLPLFQVFGKGVHAGAVVPRRIVGESGVTHLCLSCLVENMDIYGSPYLHRSHQIPGVTACWKHGTRTIERCPFCKCPFEIPKGLIISPWKNCTCGRAIDSFSSIEECALPIQTEFAKFAKDLLIGAEAVEPALLVKVYKSRILELGFRRGKNQIARTELLAAIQESYDQEHLQKIDCSYRNGHLGSWLHLLHSTSVREVPLGRHLLFTHFLFREAKHFLNSVKLAKLDGSILQNRINRYLPGNETAIRPNSVSKVQAKIELLEMLSEFAFRHGYGLEELWIHQLASMKRLVKLDPDATQNILALLANDLPQKEKVQSLQKRTPLYDRQADENWEKAIQEASVLLYANAEQPVKITKNTLLKRANVKGSCWPSPTQYPLTYFALEQCCESQWHFYARRIIWMLYKYPEYAGKEAKLVKLSKLESHKGVAVYRCFSHFDWQQRLSSHSTIFVLQAMGIQKNWHGPNPEKEFYVTGRGYTRRKGPPKLLPDSTDKG